MSVIEAGHMYIASGAGLLVFTAATLIRKRGGESLIPAALLWIYSSWLVGMLFFPAVIAESGGGIREPLYNFELFGTILPQIAGIQRGEWWAIRQFVGNTLLFVPVGFLIPLIISRRGKTPKVAAMSAAYLGITFAVESVQLVMGMLPRLVGSRVADVDDIVLNMLGMLTGYGAFMLLRRIPGTLAGSITGGRRLRPPDRI